MNWTTNRPTSRGWYWFRPNGNTPKNYYRLMETAIGLPVVLLVGVEQQDVFSVTFPRGEWLVDEMGGEFAGPIEPPIGRIGMSSYSVLQGEAQ